MAVSRRVVREKAHVTILKSTVGSFNFTVLTSPFQKTEKMSEEAIDIESIGTVSGTCLVGFLYVL